VEDGLLEIISIAAGRNIHIIQLFFGSAFVGRLVFTSNSRPLERETPQCRLFI
jgi:hypothetical protein